MSNTAHRRWFHSAVRWRGFYARRPRIVANLNAEPCDIPARDVQMADRASFESASACFRLIPSQHDGLPTSPPSRLVAKRPWRVAGRNLVYSVASGMTEIQDDIRRFIHQTFDSVVKLEVLLLLRGAADRAFSAADVAAALQVSKDMMHAPLLELCGHGLLQTGQADAGTYLYAPANEHLRSMIDAVAELYRVRRAAMVTLIYSQPVDRVRSFADAFKLRKET